MGRRTRTRVCHPEEDKNNPKDDDSWGAKENGFFDKGDDFFRD